MTQKRALIVAGMHRSGTSALAGALCAAGGDAPRSLMGGNPGNPKGYWESSRIMVLNDAALRAQGSDWSDPGALDPGWRRTPEGRRWAVRAGEAVEAEFEGARLLVLKDPRICRMAPAWLDVLDAMRIRPLPVHIHRHPAEVFRSLLVRNGFALDRTYRLWSRHALEAEAATRGRPRVFTTYRGLLADGAREVGRIARALGADDVLDLPARAAEVDGMLDPGLHHYRTGEVAPEELPDGVRRTLEVLDAWAAEGESEEGRAVLDRERAALDRVPMADGPAPSVNDRG